MPQHRYYLIAEVDGTNAQLLRILTPLPECVSQAPADAVTGYVHSEVGDMPELVSVALDVSHGDADGMLMAQEMQGCDQLIAEMTADQFERAAKLRSIAGSECSECSGYRVDTDSVALAQTGFEPRPDISAALHGASLVPASN